MPNDTQVLYEHERKIRERDRRQIIYEHALAWTRTVLWIYRDLMYKIEKERRKSLDNPTVRENEKEEEDRILNVWVRG